jgi:hypothetical protein
VFTARCAVKAEDRRSPAVIFRLEEGAHGELSRRAGLAGLSANAFARGLVLEGLRNSAGFPPELRDRIEAVHGFALEALRHLESVAPLPEKVDAVHAWTVGSRRALEAADYRELLRRLFPWVVRTVVYLDGLANVALPDGAEHDRFQKKVEQAIRSLLDDILEDLDAER